MLSVAFVRHYLWLSGATGNFNGVDTILTWLIATGTVRFVDLTFVDMK